MYKRFLSALTMVLLLLSISAKPQFAQTGAADSHGGKSAGEAYHNIQVLKGIPADDLIPAMQFITYSLGVECSYCHVEGALEKDDKKTKLTARKMMRMMFEINQNNFDKAGSHLQFLSPRFRAPGLDSADLGRGSKARPS